MKTLSCVCGTEAVDIVQLTFLPAFSRDGTQPRSDYDRKSCCVDSDYRKSFHLFVSADVHQCKHESNFKSPDELSLVNIGAGTSDSMSPLTRLSSSSITESAQSRAFQVRENGRVENSGNINFNFNSYFHTPPDSVNSE